ncbi:MAG TPA: hypothetical protein VGK67_21000 [Myxococcales bacterium]
MNTINKYCCRCHRTTRFQVEEKAYTCTSCGVVMAVAEKKPESTSEERTLIGDPMRSFRTKFAA